jgi:Dolichyl-phosphate-mannose-protein mannosyltransferase
METEIAEEHVLFLKNKRWVRILLVIAFLLIGIGVRLIDLSNPPLDFASTRQLHSLILARGYYYSMDLPSTRSLPADQRAFGIKAGQEELLVEPPLLEHLTAYTYALVGQENFEIPRLYSIFFWVLGGIPLYLLVKKLIPINGAIAALAFYELLPFGVIASRSFQPDPLMILLILWALYFQYRWSEQDTLKNALLASVFTGLAVFVKTTAVFFVGVPFIGFVLAKGFGKAVKNWRVYMMAAISLLPSVIYIALSATIGNNSGSIFGSRFFPQLYIQPHWYQSWFMMAKSVVDYIPLFMAVLAFFLLPKNKTRIIYGCLWIGYLLQGFVFSYNIYTHNYYQLPIIPMVAIGFGLVFSAIIQRIESLKPNTLARVFMAGVLLFAMALTVLKSRADLVSADYRYEETYWKQLGDKIGQSTPIVALTHDYGYRLSFWGFIKPKLWDTQGDEVVERLSGTQELSFDQKFAQITQGCDYFLVTLIDDFNSQKDLHDYLFAHYPYVQGEGYYLFDLQHPLTTSGSGG